MILFSSEIFVVLFRVAISVYRDPSFVFVIAPSIGDFIDRDSP